VNAVGTRVNDSLLHWAVYNGCMPMLRQLLASGAQAQLAGAAAICASLVHLSQLQTLEYVV
jgi:hypothetical protein